MLDALFMWPWRGDPIRSVEEGLKSVALLMNYNRQENL